MAIHRCHAHGCETPVKPELLMCLRHWRMVPHVIQRAVWATYRPGQCDDKSPSREWFEAASAAIGYVAIKENHSGLTVGEADALEAMGFKALVAERRRLVLAQARKVARIPPKPRVRR